MSDPRRHAGLRQLVERTWERNLLFSVLVELTYRCNLDCFFCYNDVGLGGTPLTTDQWLAFFRDLAAMQVLNLTLSGGEPLAHPEFFRLGSTARDLGFAVRIKTNGHAITRSVARRLKDEVDPFNLDVSLHGASAATHDRQTRVPGSFTRLLANLQIMRAEGLRVRANCTLTRWNEDELEALFALADRLGLTLTVSPQVSPRDDGDRAPLGIAPSPAGIATLYRLLAEQRRVRVADEDPAPQAACSGEHLPSLTTKNCGAGSGGVAVDPMGNVLPCVQWRRPVGNLHERSIKEIWADSPRLAEVRGVTAAAREHRDRLAAARSQPTLFCPALAETLTGHPLGVYPEVAPEAGGRFPASDGSVLPMLPDHASIPFLPEV